MKFLLQVFFFAIDMFFFLQFPKQIAENSLIFDTQQKKRGNLGAHNYN